MDRARLVMIVEGHSDPLMERTVGAQVRAWHGYATLTITHGRIVLSPGRVLRRLTGIQEIVHTAPRVVMIRTVMAPPWMSNHLIVEGVEATGTATVSSFSSRAVRHALSEAGFEINDVRRMLSLGGEYVR